MVRLFPLEVWQSREKWMPDGQTCADTCGQMHGAGAAAGRSARMCRHGEITNSGHPSAAPGDLFPFFSFYFPPSVHCTLFLSEVTSGRWRNMLQGLGISLHLPSTHRTQRLFQRHRNLQGCKEADKATLECTRAELRLSRASPAPIALFVLWE